MDANTRRLRAMSDDEILVELGKKLWSANKQLAARPPNLKEYIDEANRWLEKNKAALQEAICSDVRIREILSSDQPVVEKLVFLVADVLSGLNWFVPVGSVAEILVRNGIPKYCANKWNSDSK